MKDTSTTAPVAVSLKNISVVPMADLAPKTTAADLEAMTGLRGRIIDTQNNYSESVYVIGRPVAKFIEGGGKQAVSAVRVLPVPEADEGEREDLLGVKDSNIIFVIRDGHLDEDSKALRDDINARFAIDPEMPALTQYVATARHENADVRFLVETIAISPSDIERLTERLTTKNGGAL